MQQSRTSHERPAAQAAAARRIIHIDMDAFFASVEQLDDPSLRGRPVAVGGDPLLRGVVSAASYEARAFGVRSAMPMSRAVRLCPDLIRRPPRFGRYVEVSLRMCDILRRWTPLVEPISLDEAYLDVTACGLPAAEIAARLKTEIRTALGLTASAGAGPSKLIAKIASDAGKPDGLTVVKPSRVESFLAPLPVSRLWGVGPVTERKLAALGIQTVGQLARASPDAVAARLGPSSAVLIQLARGQDDRPVEPGRKTSSISCERTLADDTRDLPRLHELIERFTSDIASALREEGLRARTVTLRVRYADFTETTRSRTLRAPVQDSAAIAREAGALLLRTNPGRRKVRRIGVTVSHLVSAGEPFQPLLFPMEETA